MFRRLGTSGHPVKCPVDDAELLTAATMWLCVGVGQVAGAGVDDAELLTATMWGPS